MKKICPKCKKEVKGAFYYIRELKELWCKNCYFESK